MTTWINGRPNQKTQTQSIDSDGCANRGRHKKRPFLNGSLGKNPEYTVEIEEVILAVEKWKKESGVRYPAISDIIGVAIKLGWSKK